jgi:hypothetical protein
MNAAQREAVDKLVAIFLEQKWSIELLVRERGFVKFTAVAPWKGETNA